MLQKELNFDGISDTLRYKISSVFFGVYPYFDVIVINAENATLHKYVIQNDKRIFRAILETVGNSVLIPGQN